MNALIRTVLHPASVAVVGASNDPTRPAGRPLAALRRDGFRGAVYPVNPSRASVQGEPCWPSLEALPEVPEHVLAVTDTDVTIEVVDTCARLGVRTVTALAGGFADAGELGAEAERRLRVALAEGETRLIGPNSIGIVNPGTGMTLTANAAITGGEAAGGLFVASQSGSLIGSLASRGRARGVGFAALVSVGSEMDVGLSELCAAAVGAPDVTGFALFLESLHRAADLADFSAAAAAAGKPVVAYKLGRSSIGAKLSLTHTGNVAGSDDVADALLRDLGIARVDTVDGLLEATAIAVRPDGLPRDMRIGIVTCTAGGAAMFVDQLGTKGVRILAPSEATFAAVEAAVGFAVNRSAIVDLTLRGSAPARFAAAIAAVAANGEFDLVVAVVGSGAVTDANRAVQPVVDAAATTTTPLAAALVPEAPAALATLAAAGIPSFRTPETFADVIAALGRRRTRPITIKNVRRVGDRRALSDTDAFATIEQLGIRCAPFAELNVSSGRPLDETVIADALPPALQFPVAVKTRVDGSIHKSDHGGVCLDVPDAAAIVVAAGRLTRGVRSTSGREGQRILVQQMVGGVGEAMVGYRVDPDVGGVVVVGVGGVLAELRPDIALRVGPVDHATAEAMLDEVCGFAAWRGFRDLPRGDAAALVDVVVAMSTLTDHPTVVEAELNPVIIGREGQGATAVDAVVVVDEGSP